MTNIASDRDFKKIAFIELIFISLDGLITVEIYTLPPLGFCRPGRPHHTPS
jgi:hypothetical protein